MLVGVVIVVDNVDVDVDVDVIVVFVVDDDVDVVVVVVVGSGGDGNSGAMHASDCDAVRKMTSMHKHIRNIFYIIEPRLDVSSVKIRSLLKV